MVKNDRRRQKKSHPSHVSTICGLLVFDRLKVLYLPPSLTVPDIFLHFTYQTFAYTLLS
jgi:hypothetical protein